MLTISEKENLYKFIVLVIGEDSSIRAYSHGFNDNTVSVVEDMLSVDSKCNLNMKKLLTDLAASGSVIGRGWLKKLLKFNKKAFKQIDLKGYGCQISVKSRWKSAIISSAI